MGSSPSAPTDLRPSPATPPYHKKCRMFLSMTKGRSQVGTGVLGVCRAHAREAGIESENVHATKKADPRSADNHCSEYSPPKCAHIRVCTPTGARFREIAAPLTLAYKTPRLPAPAPIYSLHRPGGAG